FHRNGKGIQAPPLAAAIRLRSRCSTAWRQRHPTSMEEQNIVKQASEYVFRLFKEQLSKKLVYHNYKHTYETANEARQLGELHELSADELQDLELAAWFHDTGYVNEYDGHEEESVRFATAWLEE